VCLERSIYRTPCLGWFRDFSLGNRVRGWVSGLASGCSGYVVCVFVVVCVEARLIGILREAHCGVYSCFTGIIFICGQLIVVFLYTAVSSVMVLSVITACCFLFVCSSV
jgi:hypothetical protein